LRFRCVLTYVAIAIQQSKPQMSTGYIDAHCYRLEGVYSSILGE